MTKKVDFRAKLRKSLAEDDEQNKKVMARFDVAERLMVDTNLALPNQPQHVERVIEGGANIDVDTSQDGGNILIDVELLDDNPYNARQIYRESIIQERATSLASDGQLDAIKVTHNPDLPGRYILIDGHYRKRGALRLGWKSLRCNVITISNNIDFYRLSYVSNEERAGQTVLDNAFAWRKLQADGIAKDLEHISSLTKQSVPNVSKTMSLLKLPQSVLDILSENPAKVSLTIGYEMNLFFSERGEEETIKMARRVIAEDMSKRDIESFRKRASANTTRTRSRQYQVMISGKRAGTIKEWDNGKIAIDITVADKEMRDEILTDLKMRLSKL